MVTYTDTPAPWDVLYFRLAGDKNIHSMPLCEGFVAYNSQIIYDPKLSNESTIAFIERVENGKTYKFNREEFKSRLKQDIYENKTTIMDFVVQPEGEMMTPEVMAFLERYQF